MCLSGNCSLCQHTREIPQPETTLIGLVGLNHLIGGSTLTNPDTANDLDVLVHDYQFTPDMWRRLLDAGFTEVRSDEDSRYQGDELDNRRLTGVWEGKIKDQKVNILVIGAVFWPAYLGACAMMTADPFSYQTRDERIDLHRRLCKEAADLACLELE